MVRRALLAAAALLRLRYHWIATIVLVAVLPLTSCFDEPDSIDRREDLPSLMSRASDWTTSDSYQVLSEGFVEGHRLSELSGGLVSQSLSELDLRPTAAFEQMLATRVSERFGNRGYPAVIYSVAILFSSQEEAAAFFDEVRSAARGHDWSASNPAAAEVGELQDELVRVMSLGPGDGCGDEAAVSSKTIDGAFWLHRSAFARDQTATVFDDVITLHKSKVWLLVRVPALATFEGPRDLFECKFRVLVLEPAIGRMLKWDDD